MSSSFVAVVTCRVCGGTQERRFHATEDFHQDICAQNSLCMVCYVEKKYPPGTLIPREKFPVVKMGMVGPLSPREVAEIEREMETFTFGHFGEGGSPPGVIYVR